MKIEAIPEFSDEGLAPEIAPELDETVNVDEAVEESASTEIPEETPEVEKPEAQETVKIGEVEYTPEELQAIVAKGNKVKEWETKMPGYDLDKLYPEFTKRSQRLAQYEKANPVVDAQKELDELGIEPEQAKAFEKIAKSLGFIRQNDLVDRSVESQKESFLANHPEYLPKSVGGDEKWLKLMSEFNVYNWQANPQRVEELLEKTHEAVSKTWVESQRGNKVQENIATKKAQANAASMGGASGGTGSTKPKAPVSDLANRYRMMGWAEEDIKEILT